jgi:antitoxin YefM
MTTTVQFYVHKQSITTMRVINYTEARASLKLVLDTVTQDHDVMVINRRDGADAVVMGLDHYQSVMETLYLMSSPANAAALNKAIAQDVGRKAVPRELLTA